jgi:hypothetical protein
MEVTAMWTETLLIFDPQAATVEALLKEGDGNG